jgi:hypothetical protein
MAEKTHAAVAAGPQPQGTIMNIQTVETAFKNTLMVQQIMTCKSVQTKATKLQSW